MTSAADVKSRIGIGIALPAMIAACSVEKPATPLPDPGAPLYQPGEYAFGTDTRVEDAEAGRAAETFIEAQLDRGDLKPSVRYWVAPGATDFGALAARYDSAARQTGWQSMRGFEAQLSGYHGFAYRNDRQAFAMIWPRAGSDDRARSVTVIRYRGDP